MQNFQYFSILFWHWMFISRNNDWQTFATKRIQSCWSAPMAWHLPLHCSLLMVLFTVHRHRWFPADRSGRSHFFRFRLGPCSKIFESGSGTGTGNLLNLRIRLLFRLRLQSKQTKITNGFTSEMTKQQRWASDWIWSITNFVEFGMDPDCQSLQNLGSEPDLDWVNVKELRYFCCEQDAFFKIFGPQLDLARRFGDCTWK